MNSKNFKPALKYSRLTGVYDYLTTWLLAKTSFKQAIIAVIKTLGKLPNERILDIGCGPGRLAIYLGSMYSNCSVTGIDIDPIAIERAKKNASKKEVEIEFLLGDVTNLALNVPYDRIYSTFVFHHLKIKEKQSVLQKIATLVDKNGYFVLCDFCKADSLWDRFTFLFIRLLDGFDSTSPHQSGWLESNLQNYFDSVKKTQKISTFLGPVGIFICKPKTA